MADRGGNLVLALLILGGAGVAVWAGITDPRGGVREGLRGLLAGESVARRTATGGGFLATLASIDGTGTGTGGGTSPTGTGGGAYKLGAVKPHVEAAAAEVGGRFGIGTVYGFSVRNVSGTNTLSDHALGLALDFMTTDGDALAAYVQSNAARLGVSYIIWDRRIWSVSRSSEGWRVYYGASPHTDHVHVSFRPQTASA